MSSPKTHGATKTPAQFKKQHQKSSAASSEPCARVKTCVRVLTDPKACSFGDKCTLDHTPANIIREHALVLCRNGDACQAKKALKRTSALYTNPRFGATCIACVRQERRSEQKQDANTQSSARQQHEHDEEEQKEQIPCRFFGRSSQGCRHGDKCTFVHNMFKVMDYYNVHWCPNGDACVNKQHRNLCTGKQCGECHQFMQERFQKEREEREHQQVVMHENNEAFHGENDENEEMKPCRARDTCPNLTPNGRTCRDCVSLYNEYAPRFRTTQRLGRMR